MTGISLPPSETVPLSKEDTPSRRYSTLKLVPERYSIIQLGVSLFEQTTASTGTGFVEKRYKFTMFPSADQNLAREITLHPSAIHFLHENNMSFDAWISHGIPFCNQFNAGRVVENFLEKHENRMKLPTVILPNERRRIVLTKEADKQFHARCITRLREWLDAPLVVPAPAHREGVSLLLPRCNSFLVWKNFPCFLCFGFLLAFNLSHKVFIT
jgi:CAF1 family ribonuclease